MKCDNCDREATVHELLTIKGKVVEKHLCEQCARQAGMAGQVHVPLTQLLSQYITAQAKGAQAAKSSGAGAIAATGVCPSCGVSYAQFRHTGLLGCPDCYRSFEPQLGPLLQRAQEGATHHAGKTPRHAPPQPPPAAKALPAPKGAERQQRTLALKKQLAEAVAAEQYERAATIRDELARLEKATGGAGGGVGAGGRASPKPPDESAGEKGHAPGGAA